ncbi:ferredoxin-fold anticodon-binding domain protein [Actinidia rufa]|uniref:Ferredoxin-fold anticodon-binding domain protein n=1 Tax=Actinidia rufa TaxID=165716 RepID=A0A7J0DYH6_9ERIC|nr:ferredoxin-fold anticodon-binding domain protein [Actinidia rufa]
MKKYPSGEANMAQLQGLGCTILHEVDAGTMSQDSRLQWKLFDRIVFNFPHAGFDYREHSLFQISLHQNVVKGFFRSAYEMLASNGEVHVTHKTAYPFSKWEIEKLAEEVGLRLVDEVCFSIYDYPGYENKRGAGNRSHETFPIGECSTFKFVK